MLFLSSHAVGVVDRERANAFERVIWRACRRAAFIRQAEIEEALENPDTVAPPSNCYRDENVLLQGEAVHKVVFIVFYRGERLRSIIAKVCEGFKAKLFNNCPRTSKERHTAAMEVRARLADLHTVMGQTGDHRLRVLKAAATNHQQWLKQVSRERCGEIVSCRCGCKKRSIPP